MRRFLTIAVVAVLGLGTVSSLALYGLTQGYFESTPPHDPPPESPVLDTSVAPPSADQLEYLARTDPVGFLRACLLRYRREVNGYVCTLQKQERLNGTLGPVETITVGFREEPFSVLLIWQTPPAGMADRALYVAGQNAGKALARGRYLHIVHHRDPYSSEAMSASRYALPEFGMAKGTERSIDAWEKAAANGKLHVEYVGLRPVVEVGSVPCYVLHRTCDPPEEDGVAAVEVYVDTKNWLQVGNVLKSTSGERIAAYFFSNVSLNPTFAADQFDAKAVK